MHLELAKILRNYDRKNLSKDILTGLIIMAVSIPISMGYPCRKDISPLEKSVLP